jgi:hypothetical protein
MPDDVAATVEFRKTIVEARRQLQALLAQWRDSHEAVRILGLTASVDAVREQYMRYATSHAQLGRDRQLADREVEYLRTTVRLMDLLKLLIQIDARTRDATSPDAAIETAKILVAQAKRLSAAISDTSESTFSFPLSTLLSGVREQLRLANEALRDDKLPSDSRLNLMWDYLDALRGAFWQSSWPMPGRACPVYGLGRAVIGLRASELRGTGHWDDPIVFDDGQAPVLPLFVKIIDMATGGDSALSINFTIPGKKQQSIPVHAVEDDYPIPIDLSGFEKFGVFAIEVRAVFSSRDCTQEAFRATYHVNLGVPR